MSLSIKCGVARQCSWLETFGHLLFFVEQVSKVRLLEIRDLRVLELPQIGHFLHHDETTLLLELLVFVTFPLLMLEAKNVQRFATRPNAFSSTLLGSIYRASRKPVKFS